MLKEIADLFSGKRVLILGFGMEGRSTLEILKKLDCTIGISDKNLTVTDDIKSYRLYSGESYLDAIDDFDIVMKSPGIILLDKLTQEQREKITSQTDLLLRYCPQTIIGITGTKGKSTTSSLIYHILKSNGYDAQLIGNIGVPPLERLDEFGENTVIVCEMSCHQLEYVKASPDVAVLLNVYEEHLDHYVDFAAYRAAKENIFRYQDESDVLIYNSECTDDSIRSAVCEKLTASYDDSGDIYSDKNGISICGIKLPHVKTTLVGEHNSYNIAVALAAVMQVGCNLEAAAASIADFNGLEHRMEPVETINGVEYINDSISTIPNAAIAAVNSYPDTDTLIIGGMDRGISYKPLTDYLRDCKLKNLIVLPDSGYRVADELGETALNVLRASDLADAVKIAAQVTKTRCILSPAAASYGFYKNFEERGRHFKALVNELK